VPDPVDYIRALHQRLHRAELAVSCGMVVRDGDEIVFTGAQGTVRRIPIIRGPRGLKVGPCSPPCEDSTINEGTNRGWCKHRLAALLVLKGEVPPSTPSSS
jgi:hypothetical protein